jgi:transcriptional regulator with XRE-family HTH domain/quercetin dioxygenase-like cupin family protein
MGEPKVPQIGPRIRAERTRQERTIRALARDIGVSPSLISQIETGKSQPSVSTLYAITSALGIPVEELFDETPESALAATGTSDAAGLRYVRTNRDHGVGPHVSPDDRELLTLDTGVTWQRLGQVPHHHVDFLLVTYPPGSASSADGGLMRHPGTEYGYLISGELQLTLGFDQHTMAAGDAVCFESTTPHGYRNEGEVPAIGVWFVVDSG